MCQLRAGMSKFEQVYKEVNDLKQKLFPNTQQEGSCITWSDEAPNIKLIYKFCKPSSMG